MKNNNNYPREDYPQGDGYLDTLAREGKLPECNYPNNGVPELRDTPEWTPFSELYDFSKKKRG